MWKVCHEELGSTRGAAYILLYFPTLPCSVNSVAITPCLLSWEECFCLPKDCHEQSASSPFLSNAVFSIFRRTVQTAPISRVAFCILSTSGESDEKYSACLPLFHCELSGIKAAQNTRKGILEQHGQESLDSVEYQIQLQFLVPGGLEYWEIIMFTPS